MGFKIRIEKLVEYCGLILINLMLIFPYKLPVVKIGLIVIILLYIIWKISYNINNPILISSKLLHWFLIYISINLFYISLGLIKGNPAPMLYFPIYFLWPLFFFVSSLLIDKSFFVKMVRWMKIALFVIVLLGVIAFFRFNLEVMVEGEFIGFRPSIRPGYPFIAIAGGAITSVIFLYFFYLTLFLLDRKHTTFLDKLNILLGLFFIFFTSRRILFVNFLVVFFLVRFFICFVEWSKRKEILNSFTKMCRGLLFIFIIILCTINAFELFDFNQIADFVGNAVEDDPYDPRILQSKSLIEGWTNYPLFGNGTGIDASVVRSDLPGTYELSYLAMLFERGLFGIIIFVILYSLLMYWGVKCLKKGDIPDKYIISTLVALNIFMIANATNPYLYAFDHLWFLFLIIIIISNKRKNEDMCSCKSIRSNRGLTL